MSNTLEFRPSLFDRPFALAMGPQRCGTIWIDQYFRSRSDVCLPFDVKEIFYFDRHFQRGPEFYTSHFNPQPHHKLVMELSTTAFDHPQAPERVYDLCGAEVNLICPLRHPVRRALAVYKDLLNYGIVQGGIAEAAEQAPQILHASHYAEHLIRWFNRFSPDRVKILFYEQLEKNASQYARELCHALSLSFRVPDSDVNLLPSMNKTPIGWARDLFSGPAEASTEGDQTHKIWLEERLSEQVLALERLLDRKLSLWGA